MIITWVCCECQHETDVDVTPPKSRDPQEAGEIDPAECQCGEEIDRFELFRIAMECNS